MFASNRILLKSKNDDKLWFSFCFLRDLLQRIAVARSCVASHSGLARERSYSDVVRQMVEEPGFDVHSRWNQKQRRQGERFGYEIDHLIYIYIYVWIIANDADRRAPFAYDALFPSTPPFPTFSKRIGQYWRCVCRAAARIGSGNIHCNIRIFLEITKNHQKWTGKLYDGCSYSKQFECKFDIDWPTTQKGQIVHFKVDSFCRCNKKKRYFINNSVNIERVVWKWPKIEQSVWIAK